jgi:hypothetical protein
MRATLTRPGQGRTPKCIGVRRVLPELSLEAIIRKLRIRTYRAHVETCRLECESLARRFEQEGLSNGQRARIARRWDKVMATTHACQFLLELMQRDER